MQVDWVTVNVVLFVIFVGLIYFQVLQRRNKKRRIDEDRQNII